MCIFKNKRKMKRFKKIVNDMFEYFYSEGMLCGKGINDKGKIDRWRIL